MITFSKMTWNLLSLHDPKKCFTNIFYVVFVFFYLPISFYVAFVGKKEALYEKEIQSQTERIANLWAHIMQ